MGNSLVHAYRPDRPAVPPIAMLLPGVSAITKLTMRRCCHPLSLDSFQVVVAIG